MIGSILEKCLNLMAEILVRLEAVMEPFVKDDGLLMIVGFILLILGPVLAFSSQKSRSHALDNAFDSIESSNSLYGILARLFYYPIVFATAFLCTLSGNGSNTGMFQGMADSAVKTRLSNFLEWNDTCKYFFTFLFLYVVLKTIASILKLRFFRLFRFYVYTINFITLGFLAANIYMVLVDASRGNILMRLVALAVGFCFYSIYILIFIGMAAPLVLIVLPLAAPFIGPLWVAMGIAPVTAPVEYRSEIDVFAHMMFLSAWLDMFSA